MTDAERKAYRDANLRIYRKMREQLLSTYMKNKIAGRMTSKGEEVCLGATHKTEDTCTWYVWRVSDNMTLYSHTVSLYDADFADIMLSEFDKLYRIMDLRGPAEMVRQALENTAKWGAI